MKHTLKNLTERLRNFIARFRRKVNAVSLLQPGDIQIIGRELAIRWSNNEETYIPLEKLRRACPCAACAGEQDLTGPTYKPIVTYNEKSFTLTALDRVGGYALQPRWEDGHNSGLYSWSYLQALAQQQKIPS